MTDDDTNSNDESGHSGASTGVTRGNFRHLIAHYFHSQVCDAI